MFIYLFIYFLYTWNVAFVNGNEQLFVFNLKFTGSTKNKKVNS